MDRTSRLYRFLKKCESPPANSLTWLTAGTAYSTAMVLVGRVLLRSECKRDAQYVLFAPFSVGDVLLLYRSFQALKRANHMDNPVILAERHLTGLMLSLGMGPVRGLPSWKVIAMCKALLFTPERFQNIAFSQPWHFFDVRGLNPKAELPNLPCVLSEETRMRLFPEEWMRGRSMVLSPYEQTFLSVGEPQLPDSFWIALAKELAELGYCVFTNCDGRKELPIEGTRVFFPPLRELAGAVEYAGHCICVRSGFADWASSTRRARVTLLYPSVHFYQRFGMEAVWGKTDALELIYDLEQLPQLRQTLLEEYSERGNPE